MNRFEIIKLIYFVAAIVITLRLGYWQIIRFDDLTARAESQRVITADIEANRGNILFSDGSVLASNQPTFLVYVQPKAIKAKFPENEVGLNSYLEMASEKLTEVFMQRDREEMDSLPDEIRKINNLPESSESAKIAEYSEEQKKTLEESIHKKLSEDLYWVSLGRKVDVLTKQRIENLNLIGIGFENSSSRFYPEGSSSAHLLGFIGSDIYGADTGYFGIEGFYNGELKGSKGLLQQEKDALGLPILIGKFATRDAKMGKNLKLTIDRTVQTIVEEKIKKGFEKYGAKGVSVIVMEPKSGNILAMASYPNYDPKLSYFYPKDLYRNPITADGYEPGSTFKVLVMAAGINEGVVEPDTVCDICAGPLSIGGFTIRTWNNQYQENSTMTDTIIHSDNTGMVFVAQKLGLTKLYEYIKKFGFGEITNVDLQDETSPSLRPEGSWGEIDLATGSFGQGISVTALQITRAVSAIANGGYLMEPHIVSEIIDPQGTFTISPRVISQPISTETAKKVTEMMVQAVEEGESKFAKPKGYKVAGKTGTAQIPIAGHYDPNKTIASFVGFAPADDPKFVMLVRYNEPSSSIFGSETAAPTFFEIARELFTYYGIPPTSF